MKTANGCNAKQLMTICLRHYPDAQTERPYRLDGTWWRINAVFNDIYVTKIGMSRISFYTGLTFI